MGKELGIKVWFPYTKKLCTDNAAMIGVAAYFKAQRNEFAKNIEEVCLKLKQLLKGFDRFVCLLVS